MKKRAKRRLDYERYVQLKKSGKKIDKQLSELVEQYEALNETLKKELPKLSAMTAKVGNICLGNLVNIQARWFEIWRDKMKSVLPGTQIPEVADIVAAFQSDYKWVEEPLTELTILNPLNKTRTSQPTATDDNLSKTRSRPDEATPRPRGLSLTNDPMSSTPPAEFAKRHSGQWTQSPTASIPSPSHQFYYRADYYAGLKQGPGSPITPEVANAVRSFPPPTQPPPPRPGTGVSYDSSGAPPRQSSETVPGQFRRDSSSAQSGYHGAEGPRRFSGIFHSALPLPDDSDPSQRSSRASSRERTPINGYNVLWLAASLFEFNIETTKHEAGYPYLTYQAGEVCSIRRCPCISPWHMLTTETDFRCNCREGRAMACQEPG